MRNVLRKLMVACSLLVSLAVMADDEGKEFLRKADAHYAAGRHDVAVGYYLKAAEYDETDAFFNLGYALYNGEGIAQDFPSAVMWFKRAAGKQHAKAEYNLAFCYMYGKGVPCNYERALELLISSAKRGFTDAQVTLAECYEHGILVEQNLKESQRWKEMAEGKNKPQPVEEPAEAPVEAAPSVEAAPETKSERPPIILKAPENGRPAVIVQAPTKTAEASEKTEETQAEAVVAASADVPPTFDLQLDGELRERVNAWEQKKVPVLKVLFPRDQSFFHTDVVKVKYQLLADGLEDSTKVIAMVDAVKMDNASRAVKQANTIEVEVPNRDCTITLYAQNRAGNSEPVSVRLIRENVAQGDLPRLFCVAVGVGDYHDEKLPPLKLSAKDARDFAEVISKKQGYPFSEVQVKLLTDKEATRADIFEAMQWLQQETTPNDICVFFFAGHGYRDERDRFYFMPYGGTTDKLYNCFSATDFKNMADDINSKLIVFADACYSAALLEGSRSAAATHFLEQLRRTKNGMLLYASSASDTKSKEDPEWGNGAFTKALVSAFNGGARQQFDEGLSTQALEMHLYKEVRRITNFKQTPIFINPNGMEHFNIFTYEN